MKNKFVYFTLLIFISLFLVGCSSSKVGNYKRTDYNLFSMYDLYVLQSRNEFDSKECAKCLKTLGATESFCETYEKINIKGFDVDLSKALNDKLLEEDQVQCLMDHDVVKHYRIPYIIYKIGEIISGIFKGL